MKNQSLNRFFAVLLTFVFTGCGGGSGGGSATSGSPNLNQSSAVTVSTSVSAGGSLSPATQTVLANATANFTVVADAGYRLTEIDGCAGSLSGSVFTTGKLTAACKVTAVFALQTYNIGGSSSGLPGSVELLLQFDAGSEVLALTPGESFTFVRAVPLNTRYQVKVNRQPQGQQCVVVNGVGTVSADVSDIVVECTRIAAKVSLSGRIYPAPMITTDSDVNDESAPFTDNSLISTAQSLYHLAELNGFASAEPTNGNAAVERFVLTADVDDFFKVTLTAGQVIQLQVVDYKSSEEGGRDGDLDLYLFDQDYQLVAASESNGEFEEVVAPVSQAYFINVHAYAGISKYALRLLPAATATSATATNALEFVSHEMIVKYVGESVGVISSKSGAAGKQPVKSHRSTRVRIDPSMLKPNRALAELQPVNPKAYEKVITLRSIKAVSQRADVVYAEPNYLRKPLLVPNDSLYSSQWHYGAIGLPQAWETTTGSDGGQPVIVAVVDTGVLLEHPDLNGQLVPGYDFIANTDRARDGGGIDSNPDDPGDSETKGLSSWHGTHVAGTIAAATNNNTGTAGVAWGAKIMPIRVLGKDGGTSYDIIQGIRYAAGLANDSNTLPTRKADIANLSFGGFEKSRAEQEAYQEIRAAGVILIAAAGNNASSDPFYPAAYPEVISVSATDYANELAPYSSFGASVAVAAPGGNNAADLNNDGKADGVLSTSADDSKGSLRYVYRFYNGTSMAAPHVAGVLALMKAIYPALTPDDVDALIQSDSITDDLGTRGRDDRYGHGFINAVKAVDMAMELAAGAALPVTGQSEIIATPASVAMGFLSGATLTLSRSEDSDLQVVAMAEDIDWLTVTAGQVDSNGFGAYELGVNRSGLADGHYDGEILVTISDGAILRVPVSMQIDTVSNAGALTQIYVLLIDSETDQVAAEARGEPLVDGSVAYRFAEVASGNYVVIAGSDSDADGVICQLGEMCGAYLGLLQPQAIQVQETEVTGIDFVAEVMHGFSTARDPSTGGVSPSRSRQQQ